MQDLFQLTISIDRYDPNCRPPTTLTTELALNRPSTCRGAIDFNLASNPDFHRAASLLSRRLVDDLRQCQVFRVRPLSQLVSAPLHLATQAVLATDVVSAPSTTRRGCPGDVPTDRIVREGCNRKMPSIARLHIRFYAYASCLAVVRLSVKWPTNLRKQP